MTIRPPAALPPDGPPRRVLLVAHTGREDAREVARSACVALTAHGLRVRLLADEAADLGLAAADFDPALEIIDPRPGGRP